MTEPTVDSELIEIVGADAYMDAYAEAFDALFPGLGSVLLRTYRAGQRSVLYGAMRRAYGAAGANDEVAFYEMGAK